MEKKSGDAVFAGTRFSSRQPGWPVEQHSSGDSDRSDRATRFPGATRDVCLDASRDGSGQAPGHLRGNVAGHDSLVRALAAFDIPNPRRAGVADAPLKADFLKVPHHGSKTSSTDAFVEAVAPKFAVVSVGDGNQFGHPVDSVIQRYAAAGVRFLRTDRDGAVTALTDGQILTVRTFAEDHPK